MSRIQDLLSPTDEPIVAQQQRRTAGLHAAAAANITSHFTIEFILDTICPNCYYAMKQLMAAIQIYQENHQEATFEITCSPLILDPIAYRDAGIDFRTPKSTTRDSHKLLRFALETTPTTLRSTAFVSKRRKGSNSPCTSDTSSPISSCSTLPPRASAGVSDDQQSSLSSPGEEPGTWSSRLPYSSTNTIFSGAIKQESPQLAGQISADSQLPGPTCTSRSPSTLHHYDMDFMRSPSTTQPLGSALAFSSLKPSYDGFGKSAPSYWAAYGTHVPRGPKVQTRLLEGIFDAVFQRGIDVTDRDALAQIGANVLNMPATEILSVLGSEEWGRTVDALCDEVKSRRVVARGSGASGGCGGGGGHVSGGAGGGNFDSSGAEKSHCQKGKKTRGGSNVVVGDAVPVLIIQGKYLLGGWQEARSLLGLFDRIRTGNTGASRPAQTSFPSSPGGLGAAGRRGSGRM